jgi:hypothetical protein
MTSKKHTTGAGARPGAAQQPQALAGEELS